MEIIIVFVQHIIVNIKLLLFLLISKDEISKVLFKTLSNQNM